MSLEPSTSARVILETSKGSIEIELYAKETPVTSRWFLNSCLNDHLTGQTFDRVVKDFLIQSKSLNKDPLCQELNHRLKFDKKGVLASCGDGGFFISLTPSPELNGKHTVFGKVIGDSLYTLLRINESELDGETPLYPTTVVTARVVEGYFDDLRKEEVVKEEAVVRPKKKMRLTYDDDSEDEQEVKMVSAHEILKDRRLRNVEEADKSEKSEKSDEVELDNSEKTERSKEVGILEKKKEEKNLTTRDMASPKANAIKPMQSHPTVVDSIKSANKNDSPGPERAKKSFSKRTRPDRALRELQTKKMLEDFKKSQFDSEDEFDMKSLRNHRLAF